SRPLIPRKDHAPGSSERGRNRSSERRGTVHPVHSLLDVTRRGAPHERHRSLAPPPVPAAHGTRPIPPRPRHRPGPRPVRRRRDARARPPGRRHPRRGRARARVRHARGRLVPGVDLGAAGDAPVLRGQRLRRRDRAAPPARTRRLLHRLPRRPRAPLLVPALAPLAVFAVALTALAALGVPEELLREAGLRWREPLWFLAVFLGVQALLPRLLSLHDRAPWTSLLALVGTAVL